MKRAQALLSAVAAIAGIAAALHAFGVFTEAPRIHVSARPGPGFLLTIQASRPDGGPVPFASVHVTDANGAGQSAIVANTDERGACRIDLTPYARDWTSQRYGSQRLFVAGVRVTRRDHLSGNTHAQFVVD